MKRAEAARLGYAAMITKYPEYVRRTWASKGAKRLNAMITNDVRSRGGKAQQLKAKQLGGLKAAKKKITVLEKTIKDVLDELRIEHVFGGILDTKVRPFSVDFVIPSEDNPQIIVFATSQKSEIVGQAIAYEVIKLRKSYGDIICVAVLNEKMRYAGKLALTSEGVKLFYLSEIERLREWLRALRPSPKPQGVDVAA